MRVTNSMMRNNSMLHMQKNKGVYNDYLMQYNTQKKIQRPSDDPIVAVRALKYRTTLVEIDQYLSNIKDATSWMKATETAMTNVQARLKEMQDYCTQAATGTVNADDRKDIVTQLNQYAQYIYEQNANSDYAGRYLFTGYRTDVPMIFDVAQDDVTYTISEKIKVTSIDRYEYVQGGPTYVAGSDADDYAASASTYGTTHRVLLSYDKCDVPDDFDNPSADEIPTLTYLPSGAEDIPANYKPITDLTIAGTPVTFTVKQTKGSESRDYNEQYNPASNEIYYLPESGELVFGDAVYEAVSSGAKTLQLDYEKTEFAKNDVRPEHYFQCEVKDQYGLLLYQYNNAGDQTINYQVNFSQTLTVNTEGCNSINLQVGRTIDDIVELCNEMDVMEAKLADAEKRLNDWKEADGEEAKTALEELVNQINVQMSLQKTSLQRALSGAITVCQDAMDELNVAVADHGSRYARLEMTEAKLETQKLDTDEAKSENENADLGEAYINFTQADLLYQATLNATAKILGESLLNFI